jgi:hypothetical protein
VVFCSGFALLHVNVGSAMFAETLGAYDFDPTTSTKKSGKTAFNKTARAVLTAKA